MYRTLDSGKILATIGRLRARIRERFPDAGLNGVCAEVEQVARETEEHCSWIERPHLPLRIGGFLAVLVLVLPLAGLLPMVSGFEGEIHLFELIQVLEAGLNDLVMAGIAVFFLVTLENRVKRNRALKGLHELRVLAHVIDMHQLTKDPERLRRRGPSTASSPEPRFATAFELVRYLDYCSEMLSLVGKTAALYAQHLSDAVVLSAVNEIEGLTNSLSQKIWAKIDSADLEPAE